MKGLLILMEYITPFGLSLSKPVVTECPSTEPVLSVSKGSGRTESVCRSLRKLNNYFRGAATAATAGSRVSPFAKISSARTGLCGYIRLMASR